MSDNHYGMIDWLLQGDAAISYQANRDLLDRDATDLRAKIATTGWGKAYLDQQNPDRSWGLEFYRPKWTCTHYTLLELKNLAVAPDTEAIRQSIDKVLSEFKARDGGIGCARRASKSDVCVNGMFLNYASYFGAPEQALHSVVDFLLAEHMQDGGFNCQSNRAKPHHSSLHSTLSVLEGIVEYAAAGYRHGLPDLLDAAARSREFILQHRFFKSDHTGEIIDGRFLRFPNPPRWRYNILRALDHFQKAAAPHDPRMNDALELVANKRGKSGAWPAYAALPGKVFFAVEKPRGPSRWNTLMALRVLKAYNMTP